MSTPRTLRAAAAAAFLFAAGRAEAQASFAPTSGQLLAEAQIYTEQNISGSFETFVGQYTPSSRLEAAVWDLTANSDTLARLADLFGWSDPWEYRRAATCDDSDARD